MAMAPGIPDLDRAKVKAIPEYDRAVRRLDENVGTTNIHDCHRVREVKFFGADPCFTAYIEIRLDTLGIEAGGATCLVAKSHSLFSDRHDAAEKFCRLRVVD